MTHALAVPCLSTPRNCQSRGTQHPILRGLHLISPMIQLLSLRSRLLANSPPRAALLDHYRLFEWPLPMQGMFRLVGLTWFSGIEYNSRAALALFLATTDSVSWIPSFDPGYYLMRSTRPLYRLVYLLFPRNSTPHRTNTRGSV